MSKKLVTACMALSALAAFVLPTVASASPVATQPTGTAMATGTKILATNIGVTYLKTDPSGTTAPSTLTECSTAKLTGELTKNNGSTIEGNITTATFSGTGSVLNGRNECTGASGILGNFTPTTNSTASTGTEGETVTNGTPWCLKATGSTDTFTLSGGACGSAATQIRFILDTTKLFEPTKSIECKYTRPASTPVEGTFTTDTTGDAILSVTPGSSEGEKAKTTFKGETGNSIECPSTGTLQMSFTLEKDSEATEPIYISTSTSPELTHPTGTAATVGTKISATNIGSAVLKTDPSGTTAPSALVECATARLAGELTENGGAKVEGTIATATFSGSGSPITVGGMNECTGASGILGNLTPTTNGGGTDGESVTNGTPWCLKATGSTNTFTLSGGACGSAATQIRFILDTTKLFEPTKSIECKYSRPASTPVEGTFTTDTTGDAILSVAPGTSEAEKAKTTFKGETGNNIECPTTATLEMTFTLEIDQATATPVYIS
jgi:hypothetical protein